MNIKFLSWLEFAEAGLYLLVPALLAHVTNGITVPLIYCGVLLALLKPYLVVRRELVDTLRKSESAK